MKIFYLFVKIYLAIAVIVFILMMLALGGHLCAGEWGVILGIRYLSGFITLGVILLYPLLLISGVTILILARKEKLLNPEKYQVAKKIFLVVLASFPPFLLILGTAGMCV